MNGNVKKVLEKNGIQNTLQGQRDYKQHYKDIDSSVLITTDQITKVKRRQEL